VRVRVLANASRLLTRGEEKERVLSTRERAHLPLAVRVLSVLSGTRETAAYS